MASSSTSNQIDCIEINPTHSENARGTVIWLHGLGADGNDFAPIVPELAIPNHLGLRFIFPHAPMQAITINQGYVMRAWFDIYNMQFDSRIDREGIYKSIKIVHSLIEKEKARAIPSKNIVLAGFSQGAVIALITMLTYPEPLAGILFLSGFLPFAEELLQKTKNHHQTTPIFLAHGTEDPIVPYALGSATYETLKKHQFIVNWHSYKMGHSVCREEIEDISDWLKKLFFSIG